MAISVVQSVQINNGFSGSFGTAVALGNSIVMAVTGHNPGSTISTSAPLYNGTSVTGAAKLFSAQTTSGVGTVGAAAVDFWLLPNVQSSGTSLSITSNSSTGGFVGIFAYEITGLGGSPVLDQSVSNIGANAGDQSSGPTGAITTAPEFILGVLVQDQVIGTGYPPAGWTNTGLPGNGNDNSVAGYQIATSSGGTYNYDCGTSPGANWVAAVITLAPTAAALQRPPFAYRLRVT